MATCSSWDDGDDDHATFVRISELEKQLEEVRTYLITTRLDTQLPKSRAGGQEPDFRSLFDACAS